MQNWVAAGKGVSGGGCAAVGAEAGETVERAFSLGREEHAVERTTRAEMRRRKAAEWNMLYTPVLVLMLITEKPFNGFPLLVLFLQYFKGKN
jgi:hypothetical protein